MFTKMITRAIVYKPTDSTNKGYELLSNVQCPPLDPHDLLIQISACHARIGEEKVTGLVSAGSGMTIPVGREISGIIVDAGTDVTQFSHGNQVTGILPLDAPCSGCANYCVISEYDVVAKPPEVTHVNAAGCIGDGLKAFTALHYQAKILSGDTVLICGGTTGFCIAVIQLAQHFGAKVIATVSTDEEQAYLNSHQPPLAQIIDLRTKKNSLVSICMEETGGLGIDCVIDNGVKMFSKDFDDYQNERGDQNLLPRKQDLLNCLAVGGRWITTEYNLQIDPSDSKILFLKCASVHYLFDHVWTLSRGAQGKYLHILQDVLKKLKESILRPVIRKTVPLEAFVEAMTETRYSNVGEIVMTASHLAS